MEKIYGMQKLVGLQPFLSGTPTFSSGTPTFCQMGVLNSCFQNPSESSGTLHLSKTKIYNHRKMFMNSIAVTALLRYHEIIKIPIKLFLIST